ncbi:MAG: hypothetical protein LZF61_05400 [Nitrosomonas sp.]|nr:MAG: hypothetical protein LZF61_05400 [Nitrosomonas sp.]
MKNRLLWQLYCLVYVAIVLSCYTQAVQAVGNKAAAADFIELAAVMLKDGHHDRALLALQSVDLGSNKTDLARFYTLQGLAYLGLNDPEAAKDSLQQAVSNGQRDRSIFIYLAQAHFGLKDYRNTVNAIDKAGDLVNKDAALIGLKAESHWYLNQPEAAINALNEGQRAFPSDFRFLKRKVFYLVELGLYQEAVRLGRAYLMRSKASAADYAAFGNALRLSREFQEAVNILEIARLQYPDDELIAKLLAHTYLDQGLLNAAAFILEQAALRNPVLQTEAAEIYRRAGRLHKALTLNESIIDQKIKLKQRLSILLALKQYERAANMESSLYRTGLLEDQSVRYALAYALFSTRRFTEVNKHLDHLKDAELFRKATELRRLMDACKNEPWQCV